MRFIPSKVRHGHEVNSGVTGPCLARQPSFLTVRATRGAMHLNREIAWEADISNPNPVLVRAVLCAGTLIALTACNTGDRPGDLAHSPAQGDHLPPPDKGRSAAPMELEAQIDFSRNDLSQRLGIETGAITVSSANLVTWRSGALGCPQQGMHYTQALVPGVRIILVVGKEVHDYHAKQGGKPLYCPPERAEEPASEPGADMT